MAEKVSEKKSLVSKMHNILNCLEQKYEVEFRFHPTRKWRFDFAIPELKIAIECEGGVYTKGRHVTGQGYSNDCTKYNAANELGWHVYRYTTWHLHDKRISDVVTQLEGVIREAKVKQKSAK
jgi:very-short-patch-repair endonuclease